MAIFDRRAELGVLDDLLDRERAAILSGDYYGLQRLLVEKGKLARPPQTRRHQISWRASGARPGAIRHCCNRPAAEFARRPRG